MYIDIMFCGHVNMALSLESTCSHILQWLGHHQNAITQIRWNYFQPVIWNLYSKRRLQVHANSL